MPRGGAQWWLVAWPGALLSVAGGEADDPLRDEQGGVATGKQPFKEVCRAKIGERQA